MKFLISGQGHLPFLLSGVTPAFIPVGERGNLLENLKAVRPLKSFQSAKIQTKVILDIRELWQHRGRLEKQLSRAFRSIYITH